MIPLIISAIVGFAISEITMHYWKKKYPSKVYLFERRIGKIPPMLSSFVIGYGLGLIRDDLQDKSKWFKFQKKS